MRHCLHLSFRQAESYSEVEQRSWCLVLTKPLPWLWEEAASPEPWDCVSVEGMVGQGSPRCQAPAHTTGGLSTGAMEQ